MSVENEALKLLAAVREDDPGGLTNALTEINNSGRAPEVALRLAANLHLMHDRETRLAAIASLTRLGSSARQTVSALGNTLLTDTDPSVRRLALSALENIDPIESISYFQQAITDPELGGLALASVGLGLQRAVDKSQLLPEGPERDELEALFGKLSKETLVTLLNRPANWQDAKVPQAAVVALATTYGSEAIEPLCDYLLNWLQIQEKAEQNRGTAPLDAEEQEAGRQLTAVTVIVSLGKIGDANAIGCLRETLNKNLHIETRKLTARSLALFPEEDAAIQGLCKATLCDPDKGVRTTVAGLLGQRVGKWKTKIDAMLMTMAVEESQHRGILDADLILEAITPSRQKTEPFTVLTDYLIAQCNTYGTDPRVVEMLAALVIASAGGVRKQAADRLNAYQKTNRVQEEVLRPLRLAIGGEALQPYLEQLSQQLERDFLNPVRELNTSTSKTWQRTINIAYVGFALRTAMSVILFIVGMILVFGSYRAILAGQLNTDSFFGPGISFVAGLGTMVTVTFIGPLKEIRKSVSDVGASSAIFIAYIHSILQVSHTFSAYYQRGDMTFVELREAAELVESTMRAAIEELNRREGETPSTQTGSSHSASNNSSSPLSTAAEQPTYSNKTSESMSKD